MSPICCPELVRAGSNQLARISPSFTAVLLMLLAVTWLSIPAPVAHAADAIVAGSAQPPLPPESPAGGSTKVMPRTSALPGQPAERPSAPGSPITQIGRLGPQGGKQPTSGSLLADKVGVVRTPAGKTDGGTDAGSGAESPSQGTTVSSGTKVVVIVVQKTITTIVEQPVEPVAPPTIAKAAPHLAPANVVETFKPVDSGGITPLSRSLTCRVTSCHDSTTRFVHSGAHQNQPAARTGGVQKAAPEKSHPPSSSTIKAPDRPGSSFFMLQGGGGGGAATAFFLLSLIGFLASAARAPDWMPRLRLPTAKWRLSGYVPAIDSPG